MSSNVHIIQQYIQQQALSSTMGTANQQAFDSIVGQNHSFQLLLNQYLHEASLQHKEMHTGKSATLGSTMLSQQNIGNVNTVQPSVSGDSSIDQIVREASETYGVDEKLIHSIIKHESNYRVDATSHAGAQGLMQLMPSTARGLGGGNPYDAKENIHGGTKYIASMLKKYNGNVPIALAAYNAGPGNVDKYQGIPPFNETETYVKKVMQSYTT